MDKANTKTKKSIFRGVLDGFRSTVGGSSAPKVDLGIEETLASEHFQVTKTIRHGFPFQPTALAYDPVQNLLAIGTKSGSIRILGQPGVDCHIRHDTDFAILQLMFLVNEGALISVCADDQLHLWSLRQKKPQIIHSLKFQRERITCCHLPFQSKWMYVGTDRGNVHVINLESFVLSGYVIMWNKTIELLRKTHPGPVVHLSDNQMDTNKLLIGYQSGMLALWDLTNKAAEFHYNCSESLTSACWHHEGKQFMCSHSDGSLTVWNVKSPQHPQSAMVPHAKLGRDGKPEPCRAIMKVELRTKRNSEPYIIFSGGMPCDKSSQTSTVTIMQGTSTTVLELEHGVIDFFTVCSTPWNNDFQDPYAVAVLLQNDFIMVDLASPNYPCFENPYPMDLHESPVTACVYLADCPPDLVPAFYSVGCKQKKTGYSEKEWPVKGGTWGTATCSYPEIIVTGHADGSLKFWDASAVMLQVLYKMKTAKLFEDSKAHGSSDSNGDTPFAIHLIHLCSESRLLCVAGASYVSLFSFSRQESQIECLGIEISICYEVFDDSDSPDMESTGGSTKPVEKERTAQPTPSSGDKDLQQQTTIVKLKSGPRKWSAGYQPLLCCLLTSVDGEPPPPISSLSLNSRYGLLAFGNDFGLAVVDIVQKSCVISIGTPDLYGSLDPYSRVSRSPKQKSHPQGGFEMASQSQSSVSEEFKLPVVDQLCAADASTWELLDAPSETFDDLKQSHDKALPSAPQDEECEIGCDALEVFGLNEDPVVDEAQVDSVTVAQVDSVALAQADSVAVAQVDSVALAQADSVTVAQVDSVAVAQADSVVTETESRHENAGPLPVGGKKKWMQKIAHSKNWKISLPKAGHRHLSVPDDSAADVKSTTSANASTNNLKISHQNDSHISSDPDKVLLVTPTPEHALANSSPLGARKSPTKVTFELPSDGVDDCDASHLPPTPMTAPPLVSKHDERKLLDKMNKKLSVYLKVMRFAAAGSAFKKRREARMLKVVDLTSDGAASKHCASSMTYAEYMALERADSFSRSQSSSTSSLDNINKEAAQCLVFNDTYPRKSDNFLIPSLWAGTSLGTVLVMSLNISEDAETRKTEPVVVSPTGTIFRLKGAIVAISFLDVSGSLIPSPADSWKDRNRGDESAKEKKFGSKTDGQQSASNLKSRISPASSGDLSSDQQFVVLCSEKQARVVGLPSQSCIYKVKITETSSVAKADVITFRDSVCLACFLLNGHIMTFSLPSLKPLLDVDYIPCPDVRVTKTLCFSNNSHALYFCSPTELQKVTLSTEMGESLNEMLSDLFIPCNMPEAPKQGFFKNLFNVGSASLDREELFGEGSGKAPKGVVKYTGMTQTQENANAATSEIGRAKMLALERGEKLGELEERTEKMRLDAEVYSQAAQQLKNKYKEKKWYQL